MLARILRFSFLSFLLLSIPQAASQTWSRNGPTASCLPNTLQWAFNSLNQSPCTIAEFLLNSCSVGSGSLHIPPIQANDLGYTVSSPTSCTCNSVFYSLLSACALCQSGNLRKWSDYSLNCSSPTFITLPEGVPNGTRIPHYAFHDVLSANEFSVTSFQADSGNNNYTLVLIIVNA
ncbi:hypothetical protein BD779DRAFT_582797 [Infundibulicybe gibba]|nr:hypothetical protein BD779DRAFT_582797 [Infundibulicybe gibba]